MNKKCSLILLLHHLFQNQNKWRISEKERYIIPKEKIHQSFKSSRVNCQVKHWHSSSRIEVKFKEVLQKLTCCMLPLTVDTWILFMFERLWCQSPKQRKCHLNDVTYMWGLKIWIIWMSKQNAMRSLHCQRALSPRWIGNVVVLWKTIFKDIFLVW